MPTSPNPDKGSDTDKLVSIILEIVGCFLIFVNRFTETFALGRMSQLGIGAIDPQGLLFHRHAQSLQARLGAHHTCTDTSSRIYRNKPRPRRDALTRCKCLALVLPSDLSCVSFEISSIGEHIGSIMDA